MSLILHTMTVKCSGIIDDNSRGEDAMKADSPRPPNHVIFYYILFHAIYSLSLSLML